jgi:hypothetical protein
MMAQQPPQQSIEEQIYQQRNEWPQIAQQQPPPQVVIQQIPNAVKQQSNSVWPEKLPKQVDEKIAGHGKKEQQKDLEYSEEYGEESQPEGDDVTTTEAPKKVNNLNLFNFRGRDPLKIKSGFKSKSD